MKVKFLSRLVTVLFFGLMVVQGSASGKLKILTSIFPLEEFAAAVVGERGDVDMLLPPGAEVHTWQLRPADVLRFDTCDLFIYVGANLEPWVSDIMGALSSGPSRSLEVSRGLGLLDESAPHEEGEEHEESGDPHIWLDFGLDIEIVRAIERVLSEMDPEGAPSFRRNADFAVERLRRLDERYREGLRNHVGKKLIIAGHGAFGYLARRYGLEQISLYGLSPDSQPRPKHLMEVIDLCRENAIGTIFSEHSVSPDLARVLSKEIGARVLVLSPAHNLTRGQQMQGLSFWEIMEENLRTLQDGLSNR